MEKKNVSQETKTIENNNWKKDEKERISNTCTVGVKQTAQNIYFVTWYIGC